MVLRSMVFAAVMAYGLVACGGDPCDGGGGFFASSSERAAAPAVSMVSASVLLDSNNTVVIELASNTSGGACSMPSQVITRLVWDAARGTAVATTAIPSASARRITGVTLGGGVTSWEEVIPGLTIRASGNGSFNVVLTFTSGMTTTTLTCSGSFAVTCV